MLHLTVSLNLGFKIFTSNSKYWPIFVTQNILGVFFLIVENRLEVFPVAVHWLCGSFYLFKHAETSC